jgi:hypothetical protein
MPEVVPMPDGSYMLAVPPDKIVVRAGRKLVTIKSKCGRWVIVARVNVETGEIIWLNPGDSIKLEETRLDELREARACQRCEHNRWRKFLYLVVDTQDMVYESLGTTCAVNEFGVDLNTLFGREIKKAARTETQRILDEMAAAVAIERNRERIETTHTQLNTVFCVPVAEVIAELERIVAEEGAQNGWAHNTLAAMRERPWVMVNEWDRNFPSITREHLSRWGISVNKTSYRLMKQKEANDPDAPPPVEMQVAHDEGDRIDIEAVYTKSLTSRAGNLLHFFRDDEGVQWAFCSYAEVFDRPRNEADRANKFEPGDRISVRVTISSIKKDIVWCRMPKCFVILRKQAVEVAA